MSTPARRLRSYVLLAAAVLALAACSSPGGTESTAVQDSLGVNGRISMTSDRDGAFQMFTMEPDGSDARRITDAEQTPAHGAWSPDGARIVFTRADTTSANIWVMDADGSNPQQLTSDGSSNLVPHWSPDGARLAFESDRTGNYELFTMASDGTDVQRVTQTTTPTQNYGPKYSPDGTTLLFASNAAKPEDPDANDLWLIDVDGSNMRQLTFGYNNAESRAWSPDGSRVVFSAVVDGIAQLFVVNVDGTGLRQITTNPSSAPAFSPGGIFPTMNGAITPVWSPDGALIAFASNQDGTYEIYTVRPDGSELTRLTTTDANQLSLGWQPRPTNG